jgi:hypothetical protein
VYGGLTALSKIFNPDITGRAAGQGGQVARANREDQHASFGFVVTSSVAIAGVLLVFCYLIVPSVAAMLYPDTIGRRLAIGWTMGTVVSALGVYLSLVLDLPTGCHHRVHVRRRARQHGGRAAVLHGEDGSRRA